MPPQLSKSSPSATFSDQPFSRAIAQEAGLDESALRSGIRQGVYRNLLRGVYVANTVSDSPELRRQAVRVALGDGSQALVVGESAAWVYGAWTQSESRSVSRARSRSGYAPREIADLGGFETTTPLRTAIDMAEILDRPRAVACWDSLFREHKLTRNDMLVELPRFTNRARRERLQTCLALIDDRSRSIAESLIRVAWVEGPMPTPQPGLVVGMGAVQVRLALGLPEQQFGVLMAGDAQPPELAMLRHLGWSVIEVGARQVEAARSDTIRRMLLGEYHRALLRRVSSVSA
jgi:hypothetical protein